MFLEIFFNKFQKYINLQVIRKEQIIIGFWRKQIPEKPVKA